MNLCNDNFPDIYSKEDIDNLMKEYPGYDPAYVCLFAAPGAKAIKEFVENLYKECKTYLDDDFVSDLKTHFSQRSWELYLAGTLSDLDFNIGAHKSFGPDFNLYDEQENTIAWIEAVAPQKGDGQDKVPLMPIGFAAGVPEKELLLRLTSVLDIKLKGYNAYLKSGLVKENEPYIIAINRSELEHVDPTIPLILKCLFEIGDLTIKMKVGEEGAGGSSTSWTIRPDVTKANGSQIPMSFFKNPDNAGISAIIYCTKSISNSPRDKGEIGEDLVLVHNPLACNPLPSNFLLVGEEWKVNDEVLSKIKERKK